MRLLSRLVAVAGLVVAGGLTLPGGAAQASACSGTSGVTVVIDYGSRTTTSCAPESSSAMAALKAVAAVTPVQTQPGFICTINSYPDTACVRTPPANAYWAFFHATRGGSWTYSSTGAGSYDPPSGGVVGFAFGSGGAPSSAPPTASAPPKPKPTPKPSASSSGKPPAPKPPATSPRPSGQASPTASPGGTSTDTGATTTAPVASPTTSATPGATTSTTGSATAAQGTSDGTVAASGAARSEDTGDGSPTTLLAGLGLVGLVGSAAAYLGLRRRGDS